MIMKTKKIVKYNNKTQKITTEVTIEKLKLMKMKYKVSTTGSKGNCARVVSS